MNKYLYELGQERENEAIDRLVSGPIFDWFCEKLELIKISWPLFWVGIRVNNSTLVTQEFAEENDLVGEIDILCGPLSFDLPPNIQALAKFIHRDILLRVLVEEGYLHWPPDLSYLVAIEVKALWFNKEKKLKATKEDRLEKFHDKALRLVKMGFNKSLFLYIVGTEPVNFAEVHNWFGATIFADEGVNEFLKILKPKIKADDPLSIAVTGWGAIPGGKTEQEAGSLSAPKLLKTPIDNPCLHEPQVKEARRILENSLRSFFNQTPKPNQLPIYVLEKSGQLFVSHNLKDPIKSLRGMSRSTKVTTEAPLETREKDKELESKKYEKVKG